MRGARGDPIVLTADGIALPETVHIELVHLHNRMTTDVSVQRFSNHYTVMCQV